MCCLKNVLRYYLRLKLLAVRSTIDKTCNKNYQCHQLLRSHFPSLGHNSIWIKKLSLLQQNLELGPTDDQSDHIYPLLEDKRSLRCRNAYPHDSRWLSPKVPIYRSIYRSIVTHIIQKMPIWGWLFPRIVYNHIHVCRTKVFKSNIFTY